MASLKKDYDFFKDMGYLEGSVSVEQVVDHTFVEAALKDLGPYPARK